MVHALRSKDEEALPLQGKPSISQIIPKAERDLEHRQLEQNKSVQYQRANYSALTLITTDVLRRETGLSTKGVLQIFGNYASRFKNSLS